MANMNDEISKLWDVLEKGTDEDYLKGVMQTIGTLAATMSLNTNYRVNTVNAVQEFIDIEKTLYTDFNKALNSLGNDALNMSVKQMSLLDPNFETELNVFTENIYDRFVIAIGTAMVNERIAWKKVPGMIKDIGDTPLTLERIVNVAKDVHNAVDYCEERAKKVISSLGGSDTVTRFNKDLVNYVLEAFKEDE